MDWKEEESRKRNLLEIERIKKSEKVYCLRKIENDNLLGWWNKLSFSNKKLSHNVKLKDDECNNRIGCFCLNTRSTLVDHIEIFRSYCNELKNFLPEAYGEIFICYSHILKRLLLIINIMRCHTGGFFRKSGYNILSYYIDDDSIDILLRNCAVGILISTDLKLLSKEYNKNPRDNLQFLADSRNI